MSAEIVDLALVRAQRTTKGLSRSPVMTGNGPVMTLGGEPVVLPSAHGEALAAVKASFLFWTGSSGTRYVHTVYNLFECPPVAAANYILVKRHTDGRRTVISIGRAMHDAGSLNLAEIRLRSAQLGANEVHVHLLADDQSQSQQIEADLRGALVVA